MQLQHSLLAFWQLGSAAMLMWGAAAILPILIHLWSPRRHRPMKWAAMTFLLAAERKNARHLQVKQWIVLAVRAAILLLFAAALADPQWTGTAQGGKSNTRGPTHTLLVLDSSYSMGFRNEGQSRFDAAKELARRLVETGQPGDGYTLVALADPPGVVIAQPAQDRDVLHELDELRLTPAGASLAATLAEVESVLRRARERRADVTHHRVCVFSDLQQTAWGEATSADVRARLGRLQGLAALEIIDLGQASGPNIAVTEITIDPPLVAVQGDVQIQAAVQNFGGDDLAQEKVEILVNGQRVADERIDVMAGGTTTVTSTHRFDAAGDHLVEVRIADDALTLDNRRWNSVPVRESIRVLCVGGRPGETRHLAVALAPRKLPGGAIDVVESLASRLLEADLASFDGVFLCNVGRVSKEEAAALYGFVRRGGGLVVFAGDQVLAENYNELLAGDVESRVLPARWQETVATGNYKIDPLDYRHPIVAPFRGFEQAGLLTTPIWKYARLKPLDDAHVAAALDNGDPLIVEGRIGRGRSIVVATAASPQSVDRTSDPATPWTALPAWPSFLPLVHEMLHSSLVGHAASRNLFVGEDLTGALPANSAELDLMISGPDGLEERLPVELAGGEGHWRFAADRIGPYEVRGQNLRQRFAVNVDPRESDLTRAELDVLPVSITRGSLDSADEIASGSAPQGAGYFRWLLGAVLALLMAEPIVAWHFGGRSG
jgi:hypothetical protein